MIIPFEWNHLNYLNPVEEIGFSVEDLRKHADKPSSAWTLLEDGKIVACFGGFTFGTKLTCWAILDERITTSALVQLVKKGRWFFDEAFQFGYTRVEAAANTKTKNGDKLLKVLGLTFEYSIPNYYGTDTYNMYARLP